MRDIKKKLKIIGIILAVIAVFAVLIYFGIFWWTMLGLLVLIVVLLHFSVCIHLKASRKEGIDIRAKYLFLTLYPRKKKAKKGSSAPPPEPLSFDDDLFADADDIPDESLSEKDDPQVDIAAMIAEAEKTDKAEETQEPEVQEQSGVDTPAEDRKAETPEDKPASEEKEPPKEKSKGKIAALKEKFEKIKPYIPIGWKAVKKFCKAIRFEGVEVYGEVGRFDAHEAAIYYGAVQKIVFSLLSKIALFFTLKLKRADVHCAFGENKIDGSVELTVRVRPSTLIAIAFCTGINFLRVFLKERRKRKKAAKKAAQAAKSDESNNAATAAAS